MQPQIVHESEVHRQHVRLKIPIQAEVDGIRYQVDDWSIGGFGVESVMTSRQPGERFPVKLIFMFEEFDMTMRFDARMVYADQDHGRFGCAFLGVSQQQMEVFRYLVDAYLSGEVVSAGDILQVRGRDSSAPARLQAIYNPYGEDELWAGQAAALRHRRGLRPGRARAGGAGGARHQEPLLHGGARPMRWSRPPTVPIRAPILGRFVTALQPGQPVPAREPARHDQRPRRHRGLAREPMRVRGPRAARG